MPSLTPLTTRLRLVLICFVAVTVSLPMVWISLGKLALFGTSLIFLLGNLKRNSKDQALSSLSTVPMILLVIAAFSLGLLWTEAAPHNALEALVKHGKLLEVALLILLIRNPREAKIALTAFLLGQSFLLLSSWLMVAGWRVPWATSAPHPLFKHVVYSTYLDQTLIFSATAAIFWHLRQSWPRPRWLRLAAVAAGVTAVINVVFVQEGRTGYVAALTVLTLAFMWEIPRKWRLAGLVLAPMVLALFAYASSASFQSRVAQVLTERQSYNDKGDNASSSGFRLHAWRRSLEAIAERPISGHGTGSWTLSVKRIEGADTGKVFGEGSTSNPHQEFLLWGVELGIGGTLLLLLLIGSLIRDALSFDPPVMRATLSVVAVMGVACLFNSSLYDALIGDFFCVTLGLLLALGVRAKPMSMLPLSHPITKAFA